MNDSNGMTESQIRDKDFIHLGMKLENIMWSLQQHNIDFNELSIEEIEAIARLYSNVKPITFGEFIRFKYRVVPLLFLEDMVEATEDFELVSNDELAYRIAEKYENDKVFRRTAKKMFFKEGISTTT